MTRGQIYCIRNRNTIGSEIRKARPGVIVSNDAQNATSGVVTVVYLTTSPKEESPTHAVIEATGVPSVALCEQIDTVGKSLVGDYCGTCSWQELLDVEICIGRALNLQQPASDEALRAEIARLTEELTITTAQRDRYERLIDILSLRVQL